MADFGSGLFDQVFDAIQVLLRLLIPVLGIGRLMM